MSQIEKKVYLIGAGPGNKDLLTVKGLYILSKASVVLYDRLVGLDILDYIPQNAIKINVGKDVNNHSIPQESINKLLLDYSKTYNVVVRLKGGDPFIFGRGAEELDLLELNGIPFEVVPGVSSSTAVPLYAGIPVTHRNFSSSFHVFTGHNKDNDLTIDYDNLVKLNGTLIFLMAVSNIDKITKGLINAKMKKDTPCAIIENGTYPTQRKFISDISSIYDTAIRNEIKPPCIFIIGGVCNLSHKFDWFSKLPLTGKNIIVTTPHSNSSCLNDKLRNLGANTFLYPLIKSNPNPHSQFDITKFTKIIFTSKFGVKACFEYLHKKGLDSRIFYNKAIACIGEKTAAELKNYGLFADFIPTTFTSQQLAQQMINDGFLKCDTDVVLLLRGSDANKDIVNILETNNINFCDVPIYNTQLIKHQNIDLTRYNIVTFTSTSCVESFIENNRNLDAKSFTAYCIGDSTKAKAVEYGFKAHSAINATIDLLVEKIIEMEGANA